MAEQLNLQINIGGKEQIVSTFGELKKAIKDAEFEALKLSEQFGEADPRVVKLREEIGELKDRIQDSADATRNFAKGAGAFPAIAKGIQGIASGFAAVQGALGLIGVESEDVQKSLLKVQSALALAQGLEGVLQAEDSFKNLSGIINNKVIPSIKALGTAAQIGIGLLIAAIGTAIYAWMDYIDTQEKVKEAQKQALEDNLKFAKIGLEGEINFIEREEKLDLARLQNKKNNENEIYQTEQKYRQSRINSLQRYYDELKNKDSKEAIDALNQIKSLNVDIQAAEIIHQNKLFLIRETANKEEKDRRKKLAEDDLQAARNAFALQMQALENKSNAAKQAAIDENATMEAMWAEQNKRDDEDQQKLNKKLILEKKAKEELIANEYALADAKFQAASAGLALLGTLVSKNEKLQNALFLADRALAIAQIVISTQREIAAYASNPVWSLMPDGGAAIKASFIAGAKLRAAASIATVAATTIAKFKGGGTNAGSNFAPSIPTLGMNSPIQPQASLTQLNQQMINAIGNQAIRAYVVETDVTSSQKRIEAIKQKAKFG